MTMFDGKNNHKVVRCLSPQTINQNGDTVGEIIDLQGYHECTFVMYSGTLTDGTYTLKIEDGETSNLADAAEVADAKLISTEAAEALPATADDHVHTLGYVGGKRYVRATVTSTTGGAGGTIGVLAILGSPAEAPITQ